MYILIMLYRYKRSNSEVDYIITILINKVNETFMEMTAIDVEFMTFLVANQFLVQIPSAPVQYSYKINNFAFCFIVL